jgi:PPM family protein phosphatase
VGSKKAMKFSVFQVSRKGGRERNEDRMGYSYTRESLLLALADGMGGHPEGEVAAQLALQTMSAMFQKEARPYIQNVTEFLASALMAAHHQIIRYASEKAMLDTPRTTLVACLVQNGEAYWIHCGDSRLYFLRSGDMVTRTRDHSYVEQHSAGIIKLEKFNRNVLFTCLGSPTKPVYDISGPHPLQQGDRVMLCSDGLWGSINNDDDIVHTLSKGQVAQAVPDSVELALRMGGEHCDNVTVIAIEWETPDSLDSISGISTDSISDGVFASTIQSGVLGTAVDDLDDAAIERSIAEINEAIRRTAAKSIKP